MATSFHVKGVRSNVSGGGRCVKEKKHSSAQDATMDTDNVVSSVADVTMVSKMVSNDINTDTVNLETPLESNRGADINSNANLETLLESNEHEVVSRWCCLRLLKCHYTTFPIRQVYPSDYHRLS
ncbi:hypothetical protein Tco_0389075 [Tanacetum coccineum]